MQSLLRRSYYKPNEQRREILLPHILYRLQFPRALLAQQSCSSSLLHNSWSRNAEQAECLCKVDACSIHQRQTSLGKLRLFAEHTAIGVERMEETSKILSIVRKPERRTVARSTRH